MNLLNQISADVFPLSKELDNHLRSMAPNFSINDFEAIIQRQIFSERERYTQKKSVDESLLSSPIVDKTTKEIESLCNTEDLIYVDNYLDMLTLNIKELIKVTSDFCYNTDKYMEDLDEFKLFLYRYLLVADIDNAHAMYLSSDNWSFSVFHNVLNVLQKESTSTESYLNNLKAGIVDIRTWIYSIAENYVTANTLKEHVEDSLKYDMLVEKDYWMPMLLFPFREIRKAGTKELKMVKDKYQQSEASVAYQKLYHARYLYDALEYFGYYGFIRNAIAHVAEVHASKPGRHLMKEIPLNITLYQFNFAYNKLQKI